MSAAQDNSNDTAIRLIAEFLARESGLVFKPNKHYLFAQRLPCLLEKFGLRSLYELSVELGKNAVLRRDVIHQMTTHETFFFRDAPQFRALATEILPEIALRVVDRRRKGQSRAQVIWSAACSTGQEPYSLAMLVHDLRTMRPHLGLSATDLGIIATDISEEVLQKARQGAFSELEVSRGMDSEKKQRFFRARTGGGYEALPVLKDQISFRSLNLIRPFGALGRFELVLCRNVLIYFSQDTARRIIDRIAVTQQPGAYLMLGASESIYPRHEAYEEVLVGGFPIYRRK